MLDLLAGVLTLALPQDPGAAAAGPSVFATHSVATIVQPAPLLFPETSPRLDGAEFVPLLGAAESPRVSGTELAHLLRQHFDRKELDSIRSTGDRLLVDGTSAAQAEAAALLDFVEASLVRRLRISVETFEGELPAELPEQLDAVFLEGLGAATWRATGTTRSGWRAAFVHRRATPFVGDIEVEVSEQARIEDPIVSNVFEGVHVRVEPHVLAGGEVLLIGALQAGRQLGEPRHLPGRDGRPGLDAPRAAWTELTWSGVVAVGEPLVVVARGPVADVVVAVHVDAVSPAPAPLDQVAIVPTSALTSTTARVPSAAVPSGFEQAFEPWAWSGRFDPVEEPCGALTIDTVKDLVRSVGAAPDRPVMAERFGIGVALWGSAADLRECTQLVRHLERDLLPTHRLRVTTEAADRRYDVDVPAVTGLWHTVSHGEVELALRDFNAEISHQMSVADPETVELFRGVGGHFAVLAGRAAPSLALQLACDDFGAVEAHESDDPQLGEFWWAPGENATFRWDGPVDPEGVTLHRGSALGADRAFTQRVRLR